jgi:hypothetical protein
MRKREKSKLVCILLSTINVKYLQDFIEIQNLNHLAILFEEFFFFFDIKQFIGRKI